MSCEHPTGAPKGKAAPGIALFGGEISRRQFVVIVGGTATAIAVAGGAGVAARNSAQAKSSFWTVRLVRAGRGARLTAAGLPAFHAAPGPSVFTSQPSPAVLAMPAGSLSGHAGGHIDGASNPATSYPQPANRTWGDVVVLEVEVLNTAAVPMLFSPGQLRLKLADGLTITPQDASRSPKPIAAGATEMMWVSYFAPSDAADFSVEFMDPMHDARLALGVPRLVTAKGKS